MTKDNSRAKRRHEKQKKKKKAKEIYPDWDEAYKWADHLAGCSCSMCRNRRNSPYCKGDDKLTLQERKMKEKEAEDEN